MWRLYVNNIIAMIDKRLPRYKTAIGTTLLMLTSIWGQIATYYHITVDFPLFNEAISFMTVLGAGLIGAGVNTHVKAKQIEVESLLKEIERLKSGAKG